MRSSGDFGPESVRIITVDTPQEASKLTIPEGDLLLSADFSRSGDDLVLTGADGTKIVVEGYFANAQPPKLATQTGEALSPELIATMVKLQAPLQFAQAGSSDAAGQPIGTVQESDGDVQVTRGGTTIDLAAGDQVFLQDILVTGPGGSVSITFLDGTVFSVSENSRMVLNELIYNPGGSDNALSFSVLKGAFVFISGEIAQAQGEGMTVTTPVAVIGVRGTSVFMNVDLREIINLIDPFTGVAGTPTVSGDFGEFTLTGAGEGLEVDPLAQEIEQFQASENQLESFQNLVTSARSAGAATGRQVVPNLQEIAPEAGPGSGDEDDGAGGDATPPPEDQGGEGEGEGEGDLGLEGELLEEEQGPQLDPEDVGGGEDEDEGGGGEDDDGETVVVEQDTTDDDGGVGMEMDETGDDNMDGPDPQEGTPGPDNFPGSEGPDTFAGGAGDDSISGQGGDDQLSGGDDDDEISGGPGQDSISGDGGNDAIDGDEEADNIDGGPGNDQITFNVGDGNDNIDGGPGDDLLIALGSENVDNFVVTGDGGPDLSLSVGDDNLTVAAVENIQIQGSGSDDDLTVEGNFDGSGLNVATIIFAGEEGDDTLDASGITSDHRVAAFGGGGNDSLIGSPNDDILLGDGGDDSVDAGAGDDQIFFTLGDGTDNIDGGDDTDIVIVEGTGGADDFILTGSAEEPLTLTEGDDQLTVTGVEDIQIQGGGGDDDLTVTGDFTGSGLDPSTIFFFGDEGDDSIDASAITSTHRVDAQGGAGNDSLIGSDNDDILQGNGGDDVIDGGEGDDLFLHALGDGDDSITGGLGDDLLTFEGTDNAETFTVSAAGGTSLTLDVGTDNLTIGGVEELFILGFNGADQVIFTGDFSSSGLSTSTLTFDGGAGADNFDGSGVTSNESASAAGGAGEDVLIGTKNDDALQGNDDNDTMTGGLGNDSIDGGAGDDDVAVFSGDYTDSAVSEAGGVVTVVGPDGTDSLTGVEILRFDDRDVRIDGSVNNAPIGVDDAAGVLADQTVSIPALDVLGNDRDPDIDLGGPNTLTVTAVGAASAGLATIDPGNLSVTYNPNDAFDNLTAGQTATATFTYTVSDGTDTDTANVTITVTGVNDPTSLDTNAGATVNEGDMVTITTAELDASDPDDADENITYTVTAGPTNGQLELIGDPGESITQFTQAQLAAAQVKYVHDGSETTTDSFTFSVQDDDNAGPTGQTFNLTINPINDPTSLDTNAGITVDEDGMTVISTAELDASDPDDADADITYTVTAGPTNGRLEFDDDPGVAITSFTQQQLTNEEVKYVHNGSETTTDSFTFRVQDDENAGPTDQVFNIAVTPVNDPTSLDVNAGLSVSEGGMAAITTTELDASDVDDTDENITYTVTAGPTNGQLELIGDAGESIFQFTQAQLDAGEVKYVHGGASTAPDSFTFSVQDDENAGPTNQVFNITITGVNDPPTLDVNAGVTLNEGAAAPITTAELDASDADDADADITYTVTAGPTNGQLEITDDPGNPITSFTQQQLANGEVEYIHFGGENTSDSFTFDLQDDDGAGPTNQVFNITVTPVNDPVSLDTNLGDTAVESGNALLTTDDLSASDPDDSNENITYTVTAGPTNGFLEFIEAPTVPIFSFTQQDLIDELVQYVHDGSETTTDSFTFSVQDDENAGPTNQTFNLTITPLNDAANLNVNAGLTLDEGATEIITTGELDASDDDDADSDITFTVTAGPTNGQLEITDDPGNAITSFTQQQLANGEVQYVHDGSETTTDSFTFSVQDDENAGPTNQVFNITVNPVNDPVSLDTNLGDTAVEGGNALITTAELSASDPDDSNENITYTVTAGPANGILENVEDPTVPIFSFTQQDLIDELVQYVHDGSETTTDSFTFSVQDDENAGPTNQTFNLTITPLNDAVNLIVNDGLTIDEGGMAFITTTELDADDPDDTDENITYSVTAGPSNGQLELDDDPGNAITSFTQQQLDAGEIKYVHDGSETTTDSFTFSVQDDENAGPTNQVFNITVNPINDAPSLDLDADDSGPSGGSDFAVRFAVVTGGNSVLVTDQDPDPLGVVITDPDPGATIESATVTLTNRPDGAAESLTVDAATAAANGVTVTAYNSANGQLVLTATTPGSVSPQAFAAVLATVTYNNSLSSPDINGRFIDFVVNDGTDDSNVATSMVSFVTEFIWTGNAGNGLWSDGDNWGTGTVPPDGSSVSISVNGPVTLDAAAGSPTLSFLTLNFETLPAPQSDLSIAAGQTLTMTNGGDFNFAVVTGDGTLINAGGQLSVTGDNFLGNSFFRDGASAGSFENQDGATLRVVETVLNLPDGFVNDGIIELVPLAVTGANAILDFDGGSFTNAATGLVHMEGANFAGAQAIIQGVVNNLGSFLISDQALWDASGSNQSHQNDGDITIESLGRRLTIEDTGATNSLINGSSGTLLIQGSGVLELLLFAGFLNEGLVTGDGQIDGDGNIPTFTNAAKVAPGEDGIGSLTLNFVDFAQDASSAGADGTLQIQIASSGHDSLLVNDGDATLEGTLSLEFLSGFAPSAGDSFLIIQADSVLGNFDAIDLVNNPAGLAYAVGVENGSATLFVGDVAATPGSDVLLGTPGDDVLAGLAGNDVLRGFEGADQIQGDEGDDTGFGGSGDDIFTYAIGDGLDSSFGGPGTDKLVIEGSDTASSTITIRSGEAVDGPGGGFPDDQIEVLVDFIRVIVADGFEDIVVNAGSQGDILSVVGNFDATPLNPTTITFIGNVGDDQLDASQLTSAHNIFATLGNGSDILTGGGGNDNLQGGPDADFLNGLAGSDRLDGGAGTDFLFHIAGNGSDFLDGGADDDLLQIFGSGDNIDFLLSGGAVKIVGDVTPLEILTVLNMEDIEFHGEDGDDELIVEGDLSEAGIDINTVTFLGGTGDDSLDATGITSAHRVFASGGLDDDILIGSENDDSLAGDSGDDSLLGNDGDDILDGGEGDDSLEGGTGDDSLDGGAGDDVIVQQLGDGDDDLDGGDDDDLLQISGSAEDDFLDLTDDQFNLSGGLIESELLTLANIEDVEVFGLEGDDELTASGDLSVGGLDTSTISFFGGDGDDILDASGITSLHEVVADGGANDDSLAGSGNDDRLIGGDGDDLIEGFGGDDSISGDAGDDSFFYTEGDGNDMIDGGADDDVLEIDGSGDADSITLDNEDADATLTIDIGTDSLLVTAVEEIEIFGDSGDDDLAIEGDLAAAGVANNTVRFTGGGGNDSLNASLLASTTAVVAAFAGNLANFVISQSGNIITVTDLVGGEGSDTVTGGTALEFGDQTLSGLTLLNDTLGVLASHETLIEEDDLLAIDFTVAPDQIVYTLDSAFSGDDNLSLDGVVLGLGDSFTQQDVIDDLVFYEDTGGGTTSFNVDITAGSNTLNDQTITINFLIDGVFTFGDTNEPNVDLDLIVGDDAFGKLAILGSGSVVANSVIVGNQTTGEGVVKISGATASLTIDRVVDGNGWIIGNEGQGEALVEGGADVTVNSDPLDLDAFEHVLVGATATGNGSLTITGEGSTLRTTDINNTVQVGFMGVGTLNVNGGADLATLHLEIGRAGQGTATVSGDGTTVVISNDDGRFDTAFDEFGGFLRVGRDPDSFGQFTIEDLANVTLRPGTVASGNDDTTFSGFEFARLLGSEAEVTIDNATLAVEGLEAFGTIGRGGSAVMTVQNGGTLSIIGPGADLTLGNDINGDGFLTVTGENATSGIASSLTVDGDAVDGSSINIGFRSFGDVAISEGADFVSDVRFFSIGGETEGIGFLGLSGIGTTLTATGEALDIGNEGFGDFEMSGDAIANVTADRMTIANAAGSRGFVEIFGENTAFTFTGNAGADVPAFNVGNGFTDGAGFGQPGVATRAELGVSEGAELNVTADVFQLAGDILTIAEFRLDGLGSTFDFTGDSFGIGNEGIGILFASGDSTIILSDTQMDVGNAAGAWGFATILGNNTSLTSDGGLNVGNGAFNNNGTPSEPEDDFGVEGEDTFGLFELLDGASASFGGFVVVANQEVSGGLLVVSNSSFTATGLNDGSGQNVIVGDSGDGQLDIRGATTEFLIDPGAPVTGPFIPSLVVGSTANGSGLLNITDATLRFRASDGFIDVGNFGEGEAYIDNGRVLLEIENGTKFSIGDEVGSFGAVYMHGSNALIGGDNDRTITTFLAGNNGNGVLETWGGATIHADNFEAAAGPNASGQVRLSHDDTLLNVAQEISIGAEGTGNLRVRDGADVIANDFVVAEAGGSNGTAIFEGLGTSLTLSQKLDVGAGFNFGIDATAFGLLVFRAEATASADRIDIGDETRGDGKMVVLGEGTTVTANTEINVGNEGTGELLVLWGGQVIENGLATTKVGGAAGAKGDISVIGEDTFFDIAGDLSVSIGAFNDNGTPGVPEDDFGQQGAATEANVNVRNGGRLDADGTISLGGDNNADGTLTIGNGVVATGQVLVGTNNGLGNLVFDGGGMLIVTGPGDVAVGGNGMVSGAGKVVGDLNNDGLVEFGRDPGAFIVDGDLDMQNGGTLSALIGNRSARMQVTSTATFNAGSVLSVAFLGALDGYTPQFGDTLVIEAEGGAVNLPTASITGLAPPAGFGLFTELVDTAGDAGFDFARITLVRDGTDIDPLVDGGFSVLDDESVLFTANVSMDSLTVDSTGGVGAAEAAFNSDLTINGGDIDVIGGSPSVLTLNGVTSANQMTIDGESFVTIGTGANVSIANDVLVGDSVGADGTAPLLTVHGFLEADALRVGVQSGVFGDVTVAGFNGITVSSIGPTTDNVEINRATIGESGDGDLVIEHGGRVHVLDDLNIAQNASSNGDVVVRGDGSQLRVDDDIGMARSSAATASLTVEDGGFVFAEQLFGADASDATMTVTVDGLGSYLELFELGVGSRGTVNFTISDGGRVTVGNPEALNNIGGGGGSTSNVMIIGEHSLLQVEADLKFANGFVDLATGFGTPGAVTTATVTVNDGARVEIGGTLNLSVDFLAESTMTVSDEGTEVVAADLAVGQQGDGTLIIQSGADVMTFDESGDRFNSIAQAEGATGLLRVTGVGSTLEIGQQLAVGVGSFDPGNDFGVPNQPTQGTLEILDGASVRIFDSDEFAEIRFGDNEGSLGQGLISGTDSSLILEAPDFTQVVVGNNVGDGNLTIQDGGFLRTNFMTVGANNGAEGTVTIDGGESEVHLTGFEESTNFAAFLTVGRSGVGTMTLSNEALLVIEGGLADFPGMQLGRNEDGEGTLNLLSGSTVFIHSDVDGPDGALVNIGRSGEGNLTVSEGSTFINDDKGFVVLGREETGTGSLTVGDDASTEQSLFDAGEHLLVARAFDFGTGQPNEDPESGGSGTLSIGANGLVLAEEVHTGNGAKIEGTGRLVGDLFHAGGIVNAGLSIGTLELDGHVNLQGGTIESELGGTGDGQSDLIDVAVDMEISNGSFVFDLVNAFQPADGDIINIMDTAAGVGLVESFNPADISFGIYGIDNTSEPITFDAFGSTLETPVDADVELLVRDDLSVAVRFHTGIATGDDALFLGGNINDDFVGRDGDDILLGGAGDDLLLGNAGDDSLSGGDGDDSMDGGAGDDSYAGGAGDDHYRNTTDGGFDTVDLSGNTAGDIETAFVGSNIFDVNWDRDGDDLIIQAAVNDTFDAFENNHIRFVNHYAVGTVGLLFFEGGLEDGNDFYTNPNNPEGVELARIFTPQGLTGTDQGGFTEVILGSAANEVLTGNGGFLDFLLGFEGDDELIGSDATRDRIRAGDGDDTAFGGSGDDNIRGGKGDDSLFGGDGFDEADYRFEADDGGDGIGVTVDLNLQGGGQTQDVGDGLGTDRLEGFEGIRGTARDDLLIGDDNDNRLRGSAGDDSLVGNDGDDDLRGELGDDDIRGDDGDDQIDGGAGDDDLAGNAGNDFIVGRFGNDSISGGTGNDNILPGRGADIVNGGDDFDQVNYHPAEIDSIDYTGGAVQGEGTVDNIVGGALDATDTLSEVEWIRGTDGDDSFVGGNNNQQRFDPEGGDDSIVGNSAFDTLGYENHGGPLAGIELVMTAQGEGSVRDRDGNTDDFSGIDAYIGSGGDDLFVGSSGFDFFLATPGDDEYFGNGGGDTVDFFILIFQEIDGGVTADLEAGTATYTLDGEFFTDQLDGISGLAGTNNADSLSGDNGDNFIRGGGGLDSLFGDDGDDTFAYDSLEDGQQVATNVAVAGAGGDTIADFDVNGDDVFELDGTAFNGLSGANLVTIGSAYDGTNSGVASGAALIQDSNNNLIYDEDVQTEGYTILANPGTALNADDIESG